MESAKPAIAALLQPYMRELSAWFAPDQPVREQYEYPYLDAYWREPGERFPFLIMSDGDVAGFAFVNRHSRLGNSDVHNIAEFYVRPQYRRHGIGCSAAKEILRRFPGRWEVGILHGNEPAGRFWQRAIAAVAEGPVEHHHTDSWNGTILTFVVPGRRAAP